MAWFVAVVAAHSHGAVERSLASLGYAAFYPRLRRWVSHARSKVAVERPLLDRYVFVEINDRSFGRVMTVDRLNALLVNADGVPEPVADELVWNFRLRMMRGEFDLTIHDLPVDALVRLVEGEFSEAIARVTKVTRDKVSVVLRGSQRVVTTRRSNVSAA